LIEVRHVGIVVTNIENSLKFYRDLLGLKIDKSMNESGEYIDNMLGFENVHVKTVKMSASTGNTLVELLEFTKPTGSKLIRSVNDIGASHAAFTVSNIDEIYLKLKHSGVKFNAPPQLSPDGYAKVTFCFDPDKTPIELVQVLK
jgi:catechol 2,3-dioxygenase-like lactoylglutathione lyase family enzyme